jgi:nucleotide-binding universal stress UspA family protein
MTTERTPAVLVGVDGSPESLAALRWAALHASACGRRLVVANAWQRGRPMVENPGSSPETIERAYTDALADLVGGELAALALEIDTDVTVLRGDPADALLEHAVRSGASLVVVGACGAGGATRALLGSVSSHLTSCPVRTVAVVPTRVDAPSGAPDVAAGVAPYVVGLDGSDGSSRAVRWALSAARSEGREVVAVHVVELPIADPTPAQAQALSDEAMARARTEWCAPLVEAGVSHRVVIESGSADEALRRVAARLHPAAVVVGSRGRGPISQRLLGSVTHRLLRELDVPVVVVPSSRDCPIWQP